jgi:predicted ATPase
MADPAGITGSTDDQPPLVGRDREQAVLRERLAAALAGRGGLVLIGGEAGIGKTALAEALLAEAAEQGALVLTGRCYDLSETPPYGPWAEAFARLPVDLDGSHLPAPLGQGARPASQAALFAQARDCLAAAARRPLVLLLDDLHWADPASLELLRYLARQAATLPLLLVASYRPEDVARGHPLYALLPALVRESRPTRLDLPRLTDEAVWALVAARHPLPEAGAARLVGWLQGRAEGNPSYLGELLRALAEEGLLRPADGAWTLGDLSHVRVPPLLRQVIEGRLARLGEEARGLLAIGAVLGQEVPLALWAAVAGAEEEALLDLVERGGAARVLAETPEGTHARFVHALIRETLYEGTPPSRRRGWHRRVAEALAGVPAPDPDAVAYHFRLAGDGRTGAWLIAAGERAQRAYAYRTAAARYEAALALAGGGDPEARGWLLLRLAPVRYYDDPRGGLGHLQEAARLAAARAAPYPAAAMAALEEARALYRGEYLDDCPFYGDSAYVEERRALLRGQFIDLLLALGERHEARGDLAGAAACFRQALRVSGDDCPRAAIGLERLGLPA